MAPQPLGRLVPEDWEHVEKYPLSAAAAVPYAAPVVLGVNWYSNFDEPVRDGRAWWIGRGGLGAIRGGHAIAVRPYATRDLAAWWRFYDQGTEGACVGFASARMMTLLNRRRYDARWLYHEAQKIDEWPGEGYSGTSVRAGMDVLRDRGPRRFGQELPRVGDGIAANRWATTVDEVLACLASPAYDQVGAVPLLNSWGPSYPHIVWLPLSTLERLLNEDGEATIITDR